MSMAENELQKTEDLVKMLADSKMVHFCYCLHILYIYISCILMFLNKSQNILTLAIVPTRRLSCPNILSTR